MIVQCEECKTNFNLDDKRLRGDSAKVRCSKCRHVFMIYKDQEEPASATIGGIFDESTSFASVSDAKYSDETAVFAGDFAFEPSTEQSATEEPFAATFDSLSFTPDAAPEATLSEEMKTETSDDFSFGDMSFTDGVPAEPVAEAPVAPAKPAFDEDMLSFADVAPGDEDITPPPLAKESYDFDFATNEASEPAAPTEVKPSFDFDFSGSNESEQQPVPSESFDLGGIDFNVPTPTPSIATEPDEPFTYQVDEPSAPTFIPVPSATETGEESAWSVYRPFAIAGACATVVIGLLTGGYFYVKGAPGNLQRMGIQNIGANAEAEKGSFTITTPKAMFIKNKVNGELFVVSGNALNGYKGPRTGVEVQVTLFGKDGAELGVKTAYCGSTIDEEQLTTLPLAKIEEELTKEPSDDPLENTPVEAGKSTTCLVVFKNVPKQATDYGIEIIASHGEQLEDF